MKRIAMKAEQGDKKVKEVFKNFITYSRAKNLSQRTLDYYEENYERFQKFLDKHQVTNMQQISPVLFEQFVLHLQQKISNPKSINTVLRAIRAFLYYAMRLQYLDEFKIELLKTQKAIKETYSEREIEMLLKKPDLKKCDFTEYRNWAMVNWFLATGNRIRTVRHIQVSDLDMVNGVVTLKTTKNRKEQVIPLSKSLLKILEEYLQYRGGEGYLFPTLYGTKMTTNAVVKAINNYNQRRGVNKTSSHLFRHTFAKLWIRNGGDIFRLQKILGHSSMEMVGEYVNMFSEDLKQDFEKFNPLNQFSTDKQPITIR